MGINIIAMMGIIIIAMMGIIIIAMMGINIIAMMGIVMVAVSAYFIILVKILQERRGIVQGQQPVSATTVSCVLILIDGRRSREVMDGILVLAHRPHIDENLDP